jgi:hypothetical protein
MITVEQSPDFVSLVENMMTYVISTDEDPTQTIIYADIWIESIPYQYSFERLIRLALYPDTDGRVVFRFEDLLKHVLSNMLPNVSVATPVADNKMMRRYLVNFNENEPSILEESYYNSLPQADADALLRYVIKGGMPFHLWPSRSGVPPLFLSHKGVDRVITEHQYEWLYLLPTSSADLIVNYTMRYTDGVNNTQSLTITGNKPYLPVALPIGFPQRNYNTFAPGKTIARIDWVLPGDLMAASLYVQVPRVNYTKELYFFSPTSGVLESLLCTGVGRVVKALTRFSSQRIMPHNYTPNDADTITEVMNRRLGGELAVGYYIDDVRSEREYQAATEVLESDKVFLRVANVLLPIVLEGDSVRLKEDEDYMNGFSIRYRYAQPNTGNQLI